jgi:FG-GAP repeat
MTARSSFLVSCLILALGASPAMAQCTFGETDGTDEEYCRWGHSVAMSGNGEVALVGGPGAVFIDGIVRPFEWDGSTWIEQPSLHPELQYEYAAEFGWSVAVSYDGNTAAIGAPGDMNGDFVGYRKGAVYIFTRDGRTGEWTQQARLTEPEPAPIRSFGQAIALSDDGNTLVVGQKEHLGDQPDREESAWVFTRDVGVWSAPVELVGTDVDPADEYAQAVAIAADASRILVSAIGAGLTDGRVFIFQEDGGVWSVEQILDYPEAINWNSFGHSIAIDGDTIMIGDPWNDDLPPGDDYGYDTDNAGAVHIFKHDGIEWVREPEAIIAPFRGWGLAQYLFGYSLSLHGDYLLVGCPQADGAGWGAGAVHIVKRMDDGVWTHTGTIHSSDPQDQAEFGYSVDMAVDRADYVVGEPASTVDGYQWEGRAHFVNAVSAAYDYDVEPDTSPFLITFYFLGAPVTIAVSATGEVVGFVMDDCDDEPGSFLLTEANLTTDDPIEFVMPWTFWDVEFTDVQVTIAEIGGAAPLDDTGSGYSMGYRFTVSGYLSIEGGDPVYHETISESFGSFTVNLTGGYGEPFDLLLTDLYMTQEVDYGLGDYNPTITVTGTVDALEVAADPCPEDLNNDGFINQSDLGILLAAYEFDGGGDIDGDGDTDQSDLGLLLAVYDQACP